MMRKFMLLVVDDDVDLETIDDVALPIDGRIAVQRWVVPGPTFGAVLAMEVRDLLDEIEGPPHLIVDVTREPG